MPYCTSDDVVSHAAALSGDLQMATRVSQGITVATSVIDSKLKAKFVVPFVDPAPPLINVIAINLAAGWSLKSAFSGSPETNQYKTGEAYWKEGIEFLTQIMDGDLTLEDATTKDAIASKAAPIAVFAQVDQQILHLDVLGRYGPKSPTSAFPSNLYPGPGW